MDIREIIRNWAGAIVALRGKTLVTGGANDSVSMPSARRSGYPRPQAKSASHIDPIMLMDAHRDADLRLQQKFEEIKREEVNILDKLIPMD